jgi:hypothetical protein
VGDVFNRNHHLWATPVRRKTGTLESETRQAASPGVVNRVAPQGSDQPMLSRILIEIEFCHSGTKRQVRGTKALFIGSLLSCDVGVDLLLVYVVQRKSGINLSTRQWWPVGCNILWRKPTIALNRDCSHAHTRSRNDRAGNADSTFQPRMTATISLAAFSRSRCSANCEKISSSEGSCIRSRRLSTESAARILPL